MGKAARHQPVATDAEHAPAEQAAVGADQRHEHLVAEALAQRGAQVTDAVNEAEFERPPPGPVFAGEQAVFRAAELVAAPRLHQRDEIVVDFPLQCLQALDVAGILRQERVEHGLVFARCIEPALDADFGNQLVEAERAADHADRADDRVGIGDDLVGGAGDHVAAGSRGIFHEGNDPAIFLLSQVADAAEDQMRLRRRAAGRIDGERHCRGVAHGEGAIQRAGNSGQ